MYILEKQITKSVSDYILKKEIPQNKAKQIIKLIKELLEKIDIILNK